MTPRSRIAVLQVPPFDPHRALGGAEAITVDVVRELSAEHDVTVLTGYRQYERERTPLAGVRVLDAFPLDEHVRMRGHISPRFTTTAHSVLERANLVLTVERSLADPPPAPRLVTLGGVAYPHTLDILHHRAWDRLVVPSNFVADQITARVPAVDGVTVISNGIDTALFRPLPTPRDNDQVRVLLPARPVAEKGFHSALALVTALRQSAIPAVLTCVDQPDGLDGSGMLSRAGEIDPTALEIVPWQPREQMPQLYARCHLTVCLSTVPEGFGLVTAESIACGTPVLANPTGFLSQMLPPDHGLHLIDPNAPPTAWIPQVREALTCGRHRAQSKGRPLIAARYGQGRMRSEFARLTTSLLSEQNASPAADNARRQEPSGHSIGSWEP